MKHFITGLFAALLYAILISPVIPIQAQDAATTLSFSVEIPAR